MFNKTLLSIVLLLSSVIANASTKQAVGRELHRVFDELEVSHATSQELDQVLKSLVLIKTQLRSGGSQQVVDLDSCLDYVFPNYDRTLNAADAMDKAFSGCKKVYDLQILKFSFEQADRTLSAADAMDLAVRLNTSLVIGKIEIIEYSFFNYDRTLSASESIEKAVINSVNSGLNNITCLKSAFDRYDRTLSASEAMDKSFSNCKN